MEKAEINEYIDKIYKVLEPVDSDGDLAEIFGEFLIAYDLEFLGNLVKKQYEPLITSRNLAEDYCYQEGSENQGHIDLKTIFKFVEDILNTEDEEQIISFENYVVRRETPEEMKEEGHSEFVDWFKTDKEIDLNQLVAFEVNQ